MMKRRLTATTLLALPLTAALTAPAHAASTSSATAISAEPNAKVQSYPGQMTVRKVSYRCKNGTTEIGNPPVAYPVTYHVFVMVEQQTPSGRAVYSNVDSIPAAKCNGKVVTQAFTIFRESGSPEFVTGTAQLGFSIYDPSLHDNDGPIGSEPYSSFIKQVKVVAHQIQ